MYAEYHQDLDKLQIDHNENLRKVQEAYNEQIVIECGICRIEMDCDDKSEVLALHCGHEFHTDCVKEWLEKKSECPMCRRRCRILFFSGKYNSSVCHLSSGTNQNHKHIIA